VADLDAARAKRWWKTGRRIASLERAAAFVDDVGFALLFPKANVALPSLWEAASDREMRDLGREWGPDAERIWGWKDELPQAGLAWYGRFLRGHPSFLSPSLLADLYPWSGRPEDFEEAELSPTAHRIARMLLKSGALPTGAVREALDIEGRRGNERFTGALTELGRALVVTNYGVEDEGAGWPSATLELTARAFRLNRRRDPARGRLRAAETFLSTVLLAKPGELGAAFGWPAREARAALDRLVAARVAEKAEGAYRRVTRAGPRRPPRAAVRGTSSATRRPRRSASP
jgi:hypothetical protein